MEINGEHSLSLRSVPENEHSLCSSDKKEVWCPFSEFEKPTRVTSENVDITPLFRGRRWNSSHPHHLTVLNLLRGPFWKEFEG